MENLTQPQTPAESPLSAGFQNQPDSKKSKKSKKFIIPLCLIALVALVSAVTVLVLNHASDKTSSQTSNETSEQTSEPTSLAFDSANWSYDSSNNVYYQIGLSYVANPADTTYETLGIYVPGDYLSCTKTSETYTCELSSANVSGYTATTAPIVIPVNTPGYSAQTAPTSYSYKTASSYIEAGFIYVYPGVRGRLSSGGPNSSKTTSVSYETGAPWGVADLKAAVRYLRYNSDVLPGDTDHIFAFGHSGGGAQSSVLGATGDSALYTPYLNAIGAAMTGKNGETLSDAIAGVMSWCPITSLSVANMAYEWNMGQFASSNTRASETWTKQLSNDLAEAYANWVNSAGLEDENGNTLTLSESTSGIYLSGSYYDYLMSVISTSAATASASAPSSLSEFVSTYKSASKSVGAFDGPDNSQTENYVFADSSNNPLHFDTNLLSLLSKNDYSSLSGFDSSKYSADTIKSSLETKNSIGDAADTREALYDPLNFLSTKAAVASGRASDESEAASKFASTPAKYWRIRTGITQGDTALTTEVNLYLALKANKDIESVDFATVWGKGHTEAEISGSATSNFISWVNASLVK